MLRILLMVLRNFWRVPGAWFKLCRYAKDTERYPEQEKYDHIRYIMNLAVNSGNIDLTVTGQDKLPKENGFILYGNHQGLFDVVALVATFPRILGAVFKKELANVPFLKQIIACTKSFAMDREDVRQSLTVIQKVTEEVKQGRNYLIFPEGTRSKKGNVMGEFHGGSFRCAVKAKCPIVPVAFIDSFKVLDQKGCKKVGVQIHFLEPIPFEEYGHMKTVEIAQLVKDRIQQAIDENL
jgi:1-acyl-sn-glycerol-3-phosphate acyltransferase